MRDANLRALKFALADVPGIAGLNQTNVGGRMVFGVDGLVVGVDPAATDDQIIAAIRKAAEAKQPAPAPAAPQPTQVQPMSAPAPGSFAAELKAMMDEAKSGLARARTDGVTKVGEAVKKLGEAKDATTHVAGTLAKTIEDEAAAVMAELGQISNSLGGENG